MGMFSSAMVSSDRLSRYLTSALRELPCAAMTTRFPDKIVGAISACQKGSTRSKVIYRQDSVSAVVVVVVAVVVAEVVIVVVVE